MDDSRVEQAGPPTPRLAKLKLNARPDTADFRDALYVPSLIEVPPTRPLEDYQRHGVPVLDQGSEGACTGFALATVANYLLWTRKVSPKKESVSPQMLYAQARRYDEWPREDYSGSSARGAMKGWYKHGVCSGELWPYKIKDTDLSRTRAEDALLRPLGAYSRVNHRDLVAMHTAISEVGVLFATATVHAGWDEPGANGVIRQSDKIEGGHAFAIVGYDDRGFWIQNSWGAEWGLKGFALMHYEDWLQNGTDVWVARLGAPVSLSATNARRTALSMAAGEARAPDFYELRPHIISIGNDGGLRTNGTYGNSAHDVAEIFGEISRHTKDWTKKRLLLYAHGGLVSEVDAVAKVAKYRSVLMQHEIYPLAFIWKTDAVSTLKNIFDDAIRRRRPEGFLDAAKDFLIEKIDDTLEWAARKPGKAVWDEMKENAVLATAGAAGGARLVAAHVNRLLEEKEPFELHLVGHSAGSIFHGPLVRLLTTEGKIHSEDELLGLDGFGKSIATATLWAPACTIDFFQTHYRPAIESGKIGKLALFTLFDKAERDDTCARLYNKSLLYLVSNATEEIYRIPHERENGQPLLGMEKFVRPALQPLFDSGKADWVLGPNHNAPGSKDASRSTSHGGFDDDDATLRATLARILAHGDAKFSAGNVTLPQPERESERRGRINSIA